MIYIYTDGSAQGNPGGGGYGVVLHYRTHKKELSEGFLFTTNNRMELWAVIAGLEAIKIEGVPVTVISDSKYVVEAIEKGWIWAWEKKGFKKKANVDLWKRFIPLYHRYKPKFVWIKGHAGHIENERCDQLAREAARQTELQKDEVYEKTVLK